MAHDIRAKLAHDELDVVNIAAYAAEVFQQDMPDAPGDSQTDPVAGQVQRHYEYQLAHFLAGDWSRAIR